MKTEIKKLWVAALRSGEYKQTTGKLQDINGFCCLGVLCDISRKETGFGIRENISESRTDALGKTMQLWSGLSAMQGALVNLEKTGLGYLSAHNDNGASFLEIADAIEAQL